MVKHPAAHVVDDAVKVVGDDKAAGDLDVRAEDFQQSGGKHIVGMEFAAVGKTAGRDLHGGSFLAGRRGRKRGLGMVL